MKKLILTLFLGATCFYSFAQFSINPTAYFGGQESGGMDAEIIVPDSDTVAVRIQISLMSNFSIALSEPFDTLSNVSGAQDTLLYTHIMDSIAPGTWYIRMHGVSLITGDVDTTPAMQIIVTDSLVTPIITVSAVSPTSDGGLQPMNLNSGFDSAIVKVWLSVGDSILQTPYFVDSFPFYGNSAYSYTFVGWPNPVTFSYVFVIENSVGSDTSDIRVITLSNVPAWLSTVDSASVTDVTTTGFWHCATGDTDRVATYYIALTNTSPAIDSSTQNVAHQNVPIVLSNTFTGLADETNYYIWANLAGFGTTARYLVTTLRTPIAFSLSSDTAYTFGLTEETIVVRCSSEVPVSVMQVLVSNTSAMTTSYPSQMFTLAQGVVVQNVSVTQYLAGYYFVPSSTYYYMVQGINSDGASAQSPVYSFVFMPSSTYVEPHAMKEDIVMRGSIMEWSGEKEALVNIQSADGKLVFKTILQKGESLDLGNRGLQGIYICTLISESRRESFKVAVQ